jgi:hypothetical protein
VRRSCATGSVLLLATAVLAVLAPGSASAGDPGMPAATPTADKPVVGTRIGLRVAPRARIVGERRRVVVTVRPQHSRYVMVQQLRGGHWSTVADGRTSRAGVLRLTRPAPASLVTYYRAVAPGLETRSTVYTERASVRTRITRQLQNIAIAVPATAAPRAAVAAVVTVSPARRGRPVRLQRRVRGTWASYGNLKRESATGVARFRVVAGGQGTTDFRAVVPPRAGAPAATSHAGSLTAVDPGPATPSGLTGTPGPGQATLAWDPVTDADHYLVYIATTPGDWSLATVQPGASTTDTVTSLSNGTTYDFAVSAVDASSHESAKSAAVTVTPSCGFGRQRTVGAHAGDAAVRAC